MTAGLAALSAASIPATMRGVNHAIIFATGHADGDFDWAALAKTGQPIVIYMAMRNIEHIVAALTRGGLAPRHAGRRHRGGDHAEAAHRSSPSWTGLPSVVRELGFALPGLIVIGDIVAVRERLLQARRGNRGRAVSARGLIVSAPRSSSGKTLGHARPARRAARGRASRCARRSPDRTTSIRRFMPRRRAPRASISTPGRCRRR